MKVLKVDHEAFILIIECNNLLSSFNKARQKQTEIFESTNYSVNEGELFIHDFKTNQLEPLLREKTHPLIFENKDYFVGITFKDKEKIKSPQIYSKLKAIEDKFFFREELGFMAGTINFGNDLGRSEIVLRYSQENKFHEFVLEFEVFPTKLDYKNDYRKIIADIEKEYPGLVLDFLKKTYTGFKNGKSPNTDLIWWQVFGGLYEDFIKATKFILDRPHNRIVRQTRYVKADKIKKWSARLEEQFAEFRYMPEKNYRSEYKTLTTNTAENRFFKHALFHTVGRYKRVKTYIEKKYYANITQNFKSELMEIEAQLKILSINPFFRTIDEFQGIRQESLVLEKATGYSSIYKFWIMLNRGLSFLEGIQKIELKNIADLYQIWCFLEIKNVIQDLLGKKNPDEIDLAEIQIDDFVFKMKRGIKSKVSYRKLNGDRIDLFHDFSYETSGGNVKSYTVNQRPDIVLCLTKNDLKENYVLTYLYDAKYRLSSDDYNDGPDLPPEDAINQMHRYRDAIYYVNKEKHKPEKEVIGAYVLFPGSGKKELIESSEYYKSIQEVNIGAFPLRPNDDVNQDLFKNHLKDILGLDTETILQNIHPQKQNTYESPNPYVLIGFVRSDAHRTCFERTENPFYYTGKRKPTRFGFSNLKYFAPYIKKKGIKECYEIIEYEIIQKKSILEKAPILSEKYSASESEDERLVIWLGKKFQIKNGEYLKISDGAIGKSPYRYTKLSHIRTPNKDNKIEVLKVGKK
jgi:hypothetical protein